MISRYQILILVSKRQYDSDKQNIEKKIEDVGKKMSNTSELIVGKKMSNTSELIKKTSYSTELLLV